MADAEDPKPLPIFTLNEIVKRLERELQCNCDLDRWQPEGSTGHSWVCRIHKRAIARLARGDQDAPR